LEIYLLKNKGCAGRKLAKQKIEMKSKELSKILCSNMIVGNMTNKIETVHLLKENIPSGLVVPFVGNIEQIIKKQQYISMIFYFYHRTFSVTFFLLPIKMLRKLSHPPNLWDIVPCSNLARKVVGSDYQQLFLLSTQHLVLYPFFCFYNDFANLV
jgi:hypothetical protein